MCRRPARVLRGQTDSLWNHHKSEQCTAGSPAFSLCRGLSCHPPYRSVYCNVKYHCTLEDIVWRFCQGSLEYFVLIARAAAGRKWLPCEFLTACFFFPWCGKITWFKMHRDKWTGFSFTRALSGFYCTHLKGSHTGECEDRMNCTSVIVWRSAYVEACISESNAKNITMIKKYLLITQGTLTIFGLLSKNLHAHIL